MEMGGIHGTTCCKLLVGGSPTANHTVAKRANVQEVERKMHYTFARDTAIRRRSGTQCPIRTCTSPFTRSPCSVRIKAASSLPLEAQDAEAVVALL